MNKCVCGSSDLLVEATRTPHSTRHWIYCNKCTAAVSGDSPEQAASLWATLTQPTMVWAVGTGGDYAMVRHIWGSEELAEAAAEHTGFDVFALEVRTKPETV